MISSVPTLQEVKNEFAPDTSSQVGDSMRNMYEKVFGTPSSGGKLSDFSGTGQPSATITEINRTGSFQYEVTGNLDFHGGTSQLECHYYIIYNTTGTMPEDEGDMTQGEDFKTTTRTVTEPGPINEAIDSSSSELVGDTIYAAIYYYNGFNFDDDDHKRTNTVSRSTTADQLGQPVISSATKDASAEQVTPVWNYSDTPNEYQARIRVDGGGEHQASLESGSEVNWGSSNNPKEGTWNSLNAFFPSSTVEVQIRAVAPNANWTNSQYSPWFEAT